MLDSWPASKEESVPFDFKCPWRQIGKLPALGGHKFKAFKPFLSSSATQPLFHLLTLTTIQQTSYRTMRPSTILLPFIATLATLVAATPVPEAAELGLVRVAGFTGNVESIVEGPAFNANEGDGELQGNGGKTTGVSKREDYNPLEERGSVLLYLCSDTRCGRCTTKNLSAAKFNVCYSASPFNSVGVAASGGLGYGAYVGVTCRGMFFVSLTVTFLSSLHVVELQNLILFCTKT